MASLEVEISVRDVPEVRAELERMHAALQQAEQRLAEVAGYIGPFDHKIMFDLIVETLGVVRSALAEEANSGWDANGSPVP